MEPELTGALIALGGGVAVWVADTVRDNVRAKHTAEREDRAAWREKRYDLVVDVQDHCEQAQINRLATLTRLKNALDPAAPSDPDSEQRWHTMWGKIMDDVINGSIRTKKLRILAQGDVDKAFGVCLQHSFNFSRHIDKDLEISKGRADIPALERIVASGSADLDRLLKAISELLGITYVPRS